MSACAQKNNIIFSLMSGMLQLKLVNAPVSIEIPRVSRAGLSPLSGRLFEMEIGLDNRSVPHTHTC